MDLGPCTSFLSWDSGNPGHQNCDLPQDLGNPGPRYFDMQRRDTRVVKKTNFGKVCGLMAHVVRKSFLSSMMSFVAKNIDP